jgi:hypothetical protein
MAKALKKWPVFICYRQDDGGDTAGRVYELLRDQPITSPAQTDAPGASPVLDVYFDQTAPGVEDWTAVHEPFLKRSRAIIVICTPGVKCKLGDDDWVYQEIGWWLDNRETAPILVDPLGEGERWVPDVIAKRWPKAQLIELLEDK